MPDPVTAIVASVATVGGAVLTSSSARSAANTQADAARQAGDLQAAATYEAIAEQTRQYDISRADYEKYYNIARDDSAPWRTAGRGALDNLVEMIEVGPGEFEWEKTPGYDYRLKEGQNALNQWAAFKGKLGSTDHAKNLMKYSQDYATKEYRTDRGNFLAEYYQKLNPLFAISGLGQVNPNATISDRGYPGGPAYAANVSNLLQTGAANQANALMMGANAQAGGYINQANIMSGLGSNMLNNYLAYKYYNPSQLGVGIQR